MLEFPHGDLLRSSVSALVNAVNCRGVMGKGIAWQFRRAYPQMFDAHKRPALPARSGSVAHIHDLGIQKSAPRWIINFPTKDHWISSTVWRSPRLPSLR
jgi:O-acetyl-ADP-ribose deacetylase (regulator of RNase III)